MSYRGWNLQEVGDMTATDDDAVTMVNHLESAGLSPSDEIPDEVWGAGIAKIQ